jgi:hypothetical protein
MAQAPITFHAAFVKVQSIANGDARLTLDIPQDEAKAAFDLASFLGFRLGVAIVLEEAEEY